VNRLDAIAHDLRYAIRGLLRTPLFTIVALLTLAIGSGANTAVFSVVDGVLLKPLPYPHPEQLVAVWHDAPGAPGIATAAGGLRVSPSMLITYQDENRAFEQIGMWIAGTAAVTGTAEPEQVAAVATMGGVLQALAVPPLLGRPLERVAILGNAAGTTARALGVYYPEADVDGVELDPAVTRVGRRYFGLGDNPRLTVHTADARPFLRSTDARYDLIVVDAYRQPYVPFYLATREFFRLVRDHLTPGGIVVLNVAAVPDDKRLVSAIGGTLAAEFPQVLAWPALRFNSFLLGFTKPLSPVARDRRLGSGPRDVAPLRDLLAREARPVEPSKHPWTDDRAPVEWLTDRMIVEYAAEGGRIEEDYLPTRPAP